jgi:hypothetical protein
MHKKLKEKIGIWQFCAWIFVGGMAMDDVGQ